MNPESVELRRKVQKIEGEFKMHSQTEKMAQLQTQSILRVCDKIVICHNEKNKWK